MSALWHHWCSVPPDWCWPQAVIGDGSISGLFVWVFYSVIILFNCYFFHSIHVYCLCGFWMTVCFLKAVLSIKSMTVCHWKVAGFYCYPYLLILWIQDGTVLQTHMENGMVNDLCWYAEHGLAACFSKSKVSAASI